MATHGGPQIQPIHELQLLGAGLRPTLRFMDWIMTSKDMQCLLDTGFNWLSKYGLI